MNSFFNMDHKMYENILTNEEDIRGKLLLPFLESLGLEKSEISLEKSFSIRLGKARKVMRGRSDILYTRNGKNLFIVELKKHSVAITQDDIDQGISYARLLDGNIAPFTIITNGISTKIFDTITRTDLTGTKIAQQSSFWNSDCRLSLDEDIQIRYQALKSFVSLSSENLKYFCQKQVLDRMGPIMGSQDNTDAKYVPELYIERSEIQSAFDTFLSSDASVFGIIGTAGSGKTNTTCSIALQNLENHFVFFYNASIISSSPLELISEDLNGVFSSRTYTDVILKKLDEIGGAIKKNVLIFIDAVDECINPNLNLELSEIALKARYLNNVKICISCKLGIWKDFLYNRDTPTHLHQELLKTHKETSLDYRNPGFLLDNFNDTELKDVIPLYKKAFGFKGDISQQLLNDLKNGFFLRIFSEVYAGKNIPEKISDKNLISLYISKSIAKTNLDKRTALAILANVAKVLACHKFTALEEHKKDGIEVDKLYDFLNLPFNENIPEELFARNILIRENKDESHTVSFYYSKIRDYFICFHSYKLDKLTSQDFNDILPEFYQNYIGESALSFYMENASFEHLQTFSEFKKNKALQYVKAYDDYLNDHFKKFKHFFDPFTHNQIGIILPDDLLKENGYALYPLKENETVKVLLKNLKSDMGNNFEQTVFYTHRVHSVRGSHNSLMVKDQDETVKRNIFKGLKKIIEEGKLSAYNSDILNREMVASILYFYWDRLEYEFNLNDFTLPRFNLLYPIDLKDLHARLYRFRARYFFRKTNNEPLYVNQMTEKAIAENMEIPNMNICGDFPPFDELFKVVNILLSKGHSQLEEHHLPCPDIAVDKAKEYNRQNLKDSHYFIRIKQLSENQAQKYIISFFKALEIAYKEFIDYYFPEFKKDFTFYNQMPHEYFFYMNDNDILSWGNLGYRKSLNNEIGFSFNDKSESKKAYLEEGIPFLRMFSLDSILHTADDYRHNPRKTVDRFKTIKVDEYCVIRNWIYQLLEDDMKHLFREFD